MTTIGSETAFIDSLISRFAPSPLRRNNPHEADAELIALPGGLLPGNAPLLAVTTDTIAEEIETGLYRDPYQIGWMAAMANLSDLAAVGAEPLGLLVSETLPDGFDDDSIDKLQSGIADACGSLGTHVLGGDTNSGSALSITGTAIGITRGGRQLTRRGCAPGDILYVSGRPGRGNGFALSVFGTGRCDPFPGGYFPRARIREGMMLGGLASACMDSSDGLFATLDQLALVNGVGFGICSEWEASLDPASLDVVRAQGFPPWLLLAGCHGEFELVFTVSPSRWRMFRERTASMGWNPVEIGIVTDRPGVILPVDGEARYFDVSYLRGLSFRRRGGIGEYLEALLDYDHHPVKGE